MAREPMLDATESVARRSPPDDGPEPGRQPGAAGLLLIDAGTRHFRLRTCDDDGSPLSDRVVASNSDLGELLGTSRRDGAAAHEPARVVITGKLAGAVRERLGGGTQVLPAAAFWLAAQDLIGLPENADCAAYAIVDLSASGYLLVGVERSGQLRDDLLITNPRCGAGSGINLDRVLHKLAVPHTEVDSLLASYLGEAGRARRADTAVRVDRCGVFSTSATISDKNQGIPLDCALATTLKSEVLKTVSKLPEGFDKVRLCGRIFRWQYARDCAVDILRERGVAAFEFDPENTQVLRSLQALVGATGTASLAQPDLRLSSPPALETYPSFGELRRRYEASHRFRRASAEIAPGNLVEALGRRPLLLALDVGSTMAKVVVADADTGTALFFDARSNAGDTIETVKQIFRGLQQVAPGSLALRGIGITGSARYQVQQALARIYPSLAGRISVLVENYAHARGSIDVARRHVEWLASHGVEGVNRELCVLVDIGGEDTKVSTIALDAGELFDNAMNTKCSAGTGSLMDTLSTMFGLPSVAEAQARADAAPRALAINATCAVFLMENASKLQARGVPRDEILASANWAIVENMARTLWRQLELPANAVVLLHGQTMLSDPLALAVTHRLQEHLGSPAYALVPEHPGHRACLGLIRSLCRSAPAGAESIAPGTLLEARFEKRVIQCKGAVCGDPQARCNRCALRWQGEDGRKIAFTVGGCSAINERISRKGQKPARQPRDAYQELWDFIDAHHPRSDDPRRLVIPRSFAVSEWAYFLSRVFAGLGLPVHVDNVRDSDLRDAQPQFNIDCCAPQMGAVGQYRRLASEPHGVILAAQIERLPTDGASSGLTCTTNQGGVAVAVNLARETHPEARFHLFNLAIERLDAGALCDQLLGRLRPVFARYDLHPDAATLQRVIERALEDHRRLRHDAAELAAEIMEQALEAGDRVALVVGREYVLNPGIYDSHIRRLLRERRMTVIPSYVLDVDLDPEFATLYWRNPHVILTLLQGVAQRDLHRRLRHPRLRAAFRRIETDPAGDLLAVVQISTFSCGPDSIIAHYVAEIMKGRPFLQVTSDAVLKELAHLENRVNTYVLQLQSGLHDSLALAHGGAFEVRRLDELVAHEPLDRETDVLCLPTMGDNRAITAVFRGAGFTCLENFDEDYDLQALVKTGRKAAGQAVCAPLAALYADLARGVQEFARRKQAGDPLLAGKRRLILVDSQGPGPCRQGQYPGLHRLFFRRSASAHRPGRACNSLPAGALFEFLLLEESEGYRGSFEDWVMLRVYQGAILKGLLQALYFKGGAACRDYEEFERFVAAFDDLQSEIYDLLGAYSGPGRVGRKLLRAAGESGWARLPLAYWIHRLHGREFVKPLRRFAAAWITPRARAPGTLDIVISGEGYMRLSQAEEIFRVLLGTLGFRRFALEVSPALSFLEYLLEEAAEHSRCAIELSRERAARTGETGAETGPLRKARRKLRTAKLFRFVLRKVLARPLYAACGIPLPPAAERSVEVSRELLPTHRPIGELAPYLGETLIELRRGADVVLNVAPSGCMVSTMGEVLTPCLQHADGVGSGRVQTLLSAEGDVDEEALTLAVLKATGPRRFYTRAGVGGTS